MRDLTLGTASSLRPTVGVFTLGQSPLGTMTPCHWVFVAQLWSAG